MKKPTILVIGAGGKTGSAVVTEMLSKGWPVRAVVRREDARSARLRVLGAETVVADLLDPQRLLDAVRGTSRAYFVPAFDSRMVDGAVAFAAAAREARLEQIVQMSQWLSSPDHPSLFTRQVWLVDRLFSALPGIAHTIVNPGFFADNYLRTIDYAALLGVFPIMTGDSLNAPVSNEDIARVVAAALVDPPAHAGKSYRPTGPTLLSARDMVGVLRRILRAPVIGLPMPWWLFVRAARLDGESLYTLEQYRHYLEDHRDGAFARGAPNDVVLELTGRTSEDFETIARRYAGLPFARRTIPNRLRAFSRFMRVPFVVVGSRRLDGDDAGVTSLRPAMSNESWKTAHPARAIASHPLQRGSPDPRFTTEQESFS